MHNGRDELNLLGHTFGQFLDLLLPPVLDSETHKPFLQRLAGLGCAHALQLGQIHCLVADLHLAVESPLFRQIAYLFDIRLRYRTTVEQNFSTIRNSYPVNDADQRGLSGSVRAEQTEYSAFRDAHADVVKRDLLPEVLADIPALDNILTHILKILLVNSTSSSPGVASPASPPLPL